MFGYLLRGLVLGGTAAAQPGPLQAYYIALVTRGGLRRALPAALAPLISDGPIILLVLVILTRVPAWLLALLQVAGGLFLLFLGWGAWRAFRSVAAADAAAAEPASTRSGVLRAALMNLLSPGPYLFWATINGPILIEGWREAPVNGLAFLGGFYVALIGGLMLFILAVGLTGRIDPRVNRLLSAGSAVALFVFALYQLATGLRGLWSALAG